MCVARHLSHDNATEFPLFFERMVRQNGTTSALREYWGTRVGAVGYGRAAVAPAERPFVTDLFIRVAGLTVILVALLVVGQAMSGG